jgi:TonB family protein
MMIHQTLAEWSQWLWPFFANHLWQATLFVLVVWIAVKLFNQAPAQIRYFLWLGALAKFLVPSALLVWLIGQAGLWKVVQFGLGWPVAGVSRAAGSNLKRRIERMLTSNNQFETTIARRAAAYASFFVLAFLAVAVGLFGGDSAFAQRNKIEATTKKGVAEGVNGGVPGGESSGVRGGAPGGVSSGVRGGVPGGIEGSAHAVAQPGNPTAAVTQEPGSKTKDTRARRKTRPLILSREKAQYTQEAKDNKVEGTVVLRVVFGADSQIKKIEVVRGLPHGLTEKAIEAAKKIRFEPAMKDDQPVSVPGKIEYSFRLKDGR